MSCSSIYGIRKDYTGEKILEYKNSLLFAPTIWEVLQDKYINDCVQTPYGLKKGLIVMGDGGVWKEINEVINKCDNTADRVCWEISNQQIFYTSDKKNISDSVIQFLKQNDTCNLSINDNISALIRDNTIERFTKIANDILLIDENEFPYFVFKNTSVDDDVECWFKKYNEDLDEFVSCAMTDNIDEFYTEFVFFKNGKIDNFISNKDYKFN